MQSVLTDSLEKVLGETAPRPAELIGGAHASGFLGEVLSVQVALRLDEGSPGAIRVHLGGPLAELARMHAVRRVPVSARLPRTPTSTT